MILIFKIKLTINIINFYLFIIARYHNYVDLESEKIGAEVQEQDQVQAERRQQADAEDQGDAPRSFVPAMLRPNQVENRL